MKAKIAVIAGDGIGPEVVAEGVRVLERVARKFGHEFTLTRRRSAASPSISPAIRCRKTTLDACLAADAVLLGAIGGPKWGPSAKVRPEQGLLRLRRELGVYANLRPIKLHPALRDSSVLKPEILDGVDLVFVRELTGGIYFGEKTRTATHATDLCSYSAPEIERITRVAGRLAMHAAQEDRLDRQIQRARNFAAVARSRRTRDQGGIPRRRARAHAGGFGRDALHQAAARLRRAAHRKHVRRHPHRRRRDARELARRVAVGVARRRTAWVV